MALIPTASRHTRNGWTRWVRWMATDCAHPAKSSKFPPRQVTRRTAFCTHRPGEQQTIFVIYASGFLHNMGVTCSNCSPGEPMLFSIGPGHAVHGVSAICTLLRGRRLQMVAFVVCLQSVFSITVKRTVCDAAVDDTAGRLGNIEAAGALARTTRRVCAGISLAASLGILCCFKWYNFFCME